MSPELPAPNVGPKAQLPVPMAGPNTEIPVPNAGPNTVKKFYTKWWFWLILVTGAVIIFAPRDDGDKNSAVTTDSSTSNSIFESPNTEVASPNKVITEYVDDVSPIIGTITDSFEWLTELFSDPQLSDDSWNLQVAIALTALKTGYEDALLINPPKCMYEIHSVFIDALGDFNYVAENLPTAVDNLDTNEISRLTGFLVNGTDKLDTATAKIQSVDTTSCQ